VPPHRRTAAIVLALLSIVVFVAPALALTWGPSRPITSSGEALARRGSTAAYTGGVAVAYREKNDLGEYRVYVRRSTDGGTTWTAPTELSAGGTLTTPSLAASGSHLDAVFTQSDDGGATSQVIYRTSANGGGTWSPPLTLSAAGTVAASASVARSGSLVVVAWTDAITGKVRVRVSDNGGTTFMPKSNLANTTNRPFAGAAFDPFEAWATVAISGGEFNVAYYLSSTRMRIQHSVHGDTWRIAHLVTTSGVGFQPPSFSSEGATVLIGWTVQTSSGHVHAAYKVSENRGRGGTWGVTRRIVSTWTAATSTPVISFRDSRWRVAFVRYVDDGESHIYYRQSPDGFSWSPATKAVSGPRPNQNPVGVTHDDGKVIIVHNAGDGISQSDVRVHQGH
jgi:hypothetical protein